MSMASPPVALLTGGASGIGLADLGRLAEGEYRIAVLDLGKQALGKVAERFADRVATFAVDVSDPDAVAAVVEKAEDEIGPIEHVVACAGIARAGPTLSVARADVDLMTRMNYGGIVDLAYAGLPRMTGAGQRRVRGRRVVHRHHGAPQDGRVRRHQDRGDRLHAVTAPRTRRHGPDAGLCVPRP
ncbi:SDR family NAD(P)-dependent oxidoreductase [Streptomyces capitiformicae]|uniref:Uncharacterized protein n=1 Tax=Streptomyces capitiformicae TaxID=2014920 RepID=A0A919DH10_9ACTN|nr:SDR family NAD(P)-dependent oxidoreductase [Streptomyces capitiformicae]GHE41559.1 hypothetical protein GCM10017771_60850 [Streptomyces capitiformicae]